MTRYVMFFDDQDKVGCLNRMIEMIVHPNKDVRIIAAEGLVMMIRGRFVCSLSKSVDSQIGKIGSFE